MWRAIQDFEKAQFIKDYQDDMYTDDDIVIVNTGANYGGTTWEPKSLTIKDFVLPETLIVVRESDK